MRRKGRLQATNDADGVRGHEIKGRRNTPNSGGGRGRGSIRGTPSLFVGEYTIQEDGAKP